MNIPPPIEPAISDANKRGPFARLRNYFLTGILVTAPITITIYVTLAFLGLVDRTVSNILPQELYHGIYGRTTIPGLGLIIAVFSLIIIGWFAKNFMGRVIIRASEYVVDRVPIINTIYKAVKQVFETVMGAQAQAFREAVMFEYPREGCWAIGFVTGTSQGEVQRITNEEVVNVFVPTTPNPTSGFLLMIPRKQLMPLEMSVDDAIKLVISGGILTPPDKVMEKQIQPAKVKSASKKAAKKSGQ